MPKREKHPKKAPKAKDGKTQIRENQRSIWLLKAKYDSVILQDSEGKKVNLERLLPTQLLPFDPMLKRIFQALNQHRKVTGLRPNRQVMLTLCGSNSRRITEQFNVTEDVLRLLDMDDDAERAIELIKQARNKGVVGTNAIVEWLLERRKIKEATAVMINRRKWDIPENLQTYVHFYTGIAKCHAWGKMPDEMLQMIKKSFAHGDAHSTPVFNAALSVFAKHYKNEQAELWSLFEKADEYNIQPDAQSFTILMNGVRNYHNDELNRIRADEKIASSRRIQLVFENQGLLVQKANTILNKAMSLATPLAPPTKDEILADPKLKDEFKRIAEKPLLNIDRHLIISFLRCYVNNSAGTSINLNHGSHYQYLEQALLYLQAWCPDVRDMIQFITKKTDDLVEVRASSHIKKQTDQRVQKAEVPSAILPLASIDYNSVPATNPEVIFPRPGQIMQSKKPVGGAQAPLIDFARVPHSDRQKLHLETLHKKSKGKKGQQFVRGVKREPDHYSMNKFVLQLTLDALGKLGLYKEFYVGVWYAMSKWGGISVNLDQLSSISELESGAFPEKFYPEFSKKGWERGEDVEELDPFTKSPSVSTENTEIVDQMILDHIIYRYDEDFPESAVPARFAAELLAAITVARPHLRRESTYNAIFSILNRVIHLYNDINKHRGSAASKRRNIADNTPFKSLTTQQLRDILDPLLVLTKSMLTNSKHTVWFADNDNIKSYDQLIEKLYAVTWADAPDEHPKALEIHKRILHSGILLYRPENLPDSQNKRIFSKSILRSVQFVYNRLKDAPDLLRRDKHLMLALRGILTLDFKHPDVKEQYRLHQWRVYRNSKMPLNKSLSTELASPQKALKELSTETVDTSNDVLTTAL